MTSALLERTLGLELVALTPAGDAAGNALDALLAPHKVALLAIERQAQAIIEEAVLGKDTVLDWFRETRKLIKAVQIVSAKLSYSHISQELTLLGVGNIPAMPKLDSSYLNRLNLDLRRTLKNPDLTVQQKAQRAGLAAVSAANRSYTDMQLEMYRLASAQSGVKIEKVWTANFSQPTPPCAYCTKLHGTVVDVADEFPVPAGLKPYTDLAGPPAHPSCRCRLIPRVVKA